MKAAILNELIYSGGSLESIKDMRIKLGGKRETFDEAAWELYQEDVVYLARVSFVDVSPFKKDFLLRKNQKQYSHGEVFYDDVYYSGIALVQ